MLQPEGNTHASIQSQSTRSIVIRKTQQQQQQQQHADKTRLLLRGIGVALVVGVDDSSRGGARDGLAVLAGLQWLGDEVVAQPLEALRGDLQAGGEEGLSAGSVAGALPAGAGALRRVHVEKVLLAVLSDAQRGGDVAHQRLGVLAEVGEAGVDLLEALVAQRVDLCEVGAETLEVGRVDDGFGVVGVDFVCDGEGLGGVGVLADVGDGLGDEGVRGEVLCSVRHGTCEVYGVEGGGLTAKKRELGTSPLTVA